MINAGVIGYGYWGPNIVRNFKNNPGINVLKVCDNRENRLKIANLSYPDIGTCSDYNQILKDEKIDLVAIVTPVYTHYDLAKTALENGKHVFLEKPMTATVKQAEELIEIAEKNGLVLMVDHTFIFTPTVKKIKELHDKQILGDLYYYDSVRVNLGLFQHDINVIWDLAPHDISIMDYVLDGKKPKSVSAIGAGHIGSGLEDVAYLTMKFDDDFIANFSVNWLSPVKIRRTLIAGNKKMLVWDDLEADEKIKIYDTGVEVKNSEGIYKILVDYRVGDMNCPRLDRSEALQVETQHLVECIKEKKMPVNDGKAGHRVVQILEASNFSLKSDGKLVKI